MEEMLHVEALNSGRHTSVIQMTKLDDTSNNLPVTVTVTPLATP
jgi:hypothetical protein